MFLHGVLRRELAVALHVDDGLRLDCGDFGGVDAVLLHSGVVCFRFLQSNPVVGAVGRDGHDDARGVVGVDEVRGQDEHVVARDGVRDVLADQSLAGEAVADLHVVCLQFQFLRRGLRDEPRLAIDVGLDVLRVGVDVGVRDAVDRLGAQRRHRDGDFVYSLAAPVRISTSVYS